MSDQRARVWSFIGYPGDSLPDNYSSILSDEFHLCWAESPVHDADLNGDGSEKKKHIHFVLSFDGMKSFDQIKEITDFLHCPSPQKCRNVRSLVRYFIHLDNPDKHQYKEDEIKCHGGFLIDDYLKRSKSQYNELCRDIRRFCRDNHVCEFYKLVDLCDELEQWEWLDILQNRNTTFFSAYLKSLHFSEREQFQDLSYYESYLVGKFGSNEK